MSGGEEINTASALWLPIYRKKTFAGKVMSLVSQTSDVIKLKQAEGMKHLVSRQEERHSQHVS